MHHGITVCIHIFNSLRFCNSVTTRRMNWTLTPIQARQILEHNNMFNDLHFAWEFFKQYAELFDDNLQAFAEYEHIYLENAGRLGYEIIDTEYEYIATGFESESDLKASACIVIMEIIEEKIQSRIRDKVIESYNIFFTVEKN